MPALDYSRVAELYDDYCVFAGDVPYFVDLAAGCRGPILELMAGTGRISLPLVQAGAALTCLDSSLAMLAVLRRKLREERLGAGIVCADVAALPAGPRFDLVLLPFQGFSELVGEDEQHRTLRSVAGCLAPGGRFVCTLHNPAARLRTVDGSWHQVGTFERPGLGTLVLSLQATHEPDSRIVTGQQRIEVRDRRGEVSTRVVVDLRFSLLPLAELLALAGEEGLALTSLVGDYAGNPYDESTSPAIVATFERADGSPPAVGRTP